MVVKIRLARFGRARQPIYNIVVAQARSARNSKPMEVLGVYDPLPKAPLASNDPIDLTTTAAAAVAQEGQGATEAGNGNGMEKNEMTRQKRYKDVKLDTSRTKYWLGVGAQPSEPVERLLCMMGLMEPKPRKTKQSLNPSA